MTKILAKEQVCFIVLPGLAPDPQSVIPMKHYFEQHGYAAVVADFWGNATVTDFSKLTIEECLSGVASLIAETKKKYPVVVGVGISLGGALFIEHAKTHTDLDYIASIGTPFKLKNAWLISLGIALGPIIHPVWKIFSRSQRQRPLPIKAGRMSTNFFEGRFAENLDKVKTPVLFLHSKKDPVADYKAIYKYSQKFTNTTTEIVISEIGGHEMNYDPKLINGTIFEFLGL